ncbi:UNVERIFIED_CONTAM: hypothetical protein PYX00_011636 [Menopon gallinae]|uniref:Uncharacterized protein n=1 Tax=Menopon gallinae TaxID=328185 RepID=A0AAW2H7Z7_9NEOP
MNWDTIPRRKKETMKSIAGLRVLTTSQVLASSNSISVSIWTPSVSWRTTARDIEPTKEKVTASRSLKRHPIITKAATSSTKSTSFARSPFGRKSKRLLGEDAMLQETAKIAESMRRRAPLHTGTHPECRDAAACSTDNWCTASAPAAHGRWQAIGWVWGYVRGDLVQKMGCLQRAIRLIFSPLRRSAKKSRSPRNTFSVSTQTEISNSTVCESEDKSCSGSVETSTDEEPRSCMEEKRRGVARPRKKRDDDAPSLESDGEQSTSTAEEKRRVPAKKKKAKNILGESVIVEKPPKKERGRGKPREKPAEEPRVLSSTARGDSMQDTSEEHVSRRSRADAQKKSSRRTVHVNRREAKRLDMNAIDSRSDTQTDYSFIIDNYIGSDAGVAEARDAYRQKDYSVLLKHRLYEYIESLDSHNNQSVSFWE